MDQALKSQLTKQLILDKSFELIYKDGFKATSVNQIMKATSLTKGAFYHHFKDKQEIGIAVIDQYIFNRVTKGMILPLREEKEVTQKLKDIFTNRILSFSDFEKENGCPANNLINEIGNSEEIYQNALKKVIDHWKEELILLLESEKKKGNIREEVDSKAVATFLICSFEGIRGIRKLYKEDSMLDNYLNATSAYIDQLK